MAQAAGPDVSMRPLARPAVQTVQVTNPSQAGLEQWLRGFRAQALEAGISGQTYDAALAGVTYQPEVIRRDRNQAEFTKTVWDYLDTAVSDLRVSNGKSALAKWDKTLSAIDPGVEASLYGHTDFMAADDSIGGLLVATRFSLNQHGLVAANLFQHA